MATSNTKVFLSERLNKQIQAWCGVNSLLYTDGNLNWTPAPVSPLPKFLPRKHYDYLTKIQPIWNKLMDRVARNREFITKELEFVAKADPFTDRLLRIYDGVPEDVLQNSHQLGIFRSDYMIDEHYDAPLQIEINTVSSGFACLSQKIGNLQNYLLTRNKHDHELINIGREIYDIPAHDHFELPHSVEESQSLQKVAAAMALAHNTYHQKTAVILFIVQPFEKNVTSSLHVSS
jgi:glutathione synthase